ncbi:MAG TPA: hypothetical protein VGS19_30085 [Streptosporangiaceae bacterium]|nr:hypothetical protein [Streptosporangiaceae bacterium]
MIARILRTPLGVGLAWVAALAEDVVAGLLAVLCKAASGDLPGLPQPAEAQVSNAAAAARPAAVRQWPVVRPRQ